MVMRMNACAPREGLWEVLRGACLQGPYRASVDAVVMPRLLRIFPALILLSQLAAANPISSEDLQFFENRIRPLLADHCYKCHAATARKIKGGLLLDRKAGWVKGGDSGKVIVPGKPEESLLIRMVERDPDHEPMPPKTSLGKEQVEDLREWVKRGALDPRSEDVGEAVVSGKDFDLDERRKWWSLQPVEQVTMPGVKAGDWPVNEVDRFILAGLEKRGWDPAPGAGKEHLLRRVSLVLTGLAPTESELDSFMKDESDGAYEKVVDRLLGSPRFGERWARHWMDVVRFAETKAFEADYTMPYVDRYRDYLIRAFNSDIPYDQFVMEALAGDRLEKPRLNRESGINESVIGPGYLYLTDGQHGPPDIHGDETRIFDSMIKVCGVAFQGLTVNCAKCHDHKFDAITERDYYSFYGMLRSSRLHYANIAPPEKKAEVEARLRRAKQELMADVFRAVEKEAAGIGQVLPLIEEFEKGVRFEILQQKLNLPLKKGEKQEGRLATFVKESEEGLKALASRSGVDADLLLKWFRWKHDKNIPPELAGLKAIINDKPVAEVEAASSRGETSNENYRFGMQSGSLGKWIASGPGFVSADTDGFLLSQGGDQVIRATIGTGVSTGTLSSRLDGVLRSPDFILDGGAVDLWVRGRHATVRLVVRNYELTGKGPTTGRLKVGVNSDGWKKISFGTHLWKGEPAFLEIQHQGPGMDCLGRNGRPPAPAEDAWVAVAAGKLPQWLGVWSGPARSEDRAKAVAVAIAGIAESARKGVIGPGQREVLGALLQSGLMHPDPAKHLEIKGKLEAFRKISRELPSPVYVRSVVDGVPIDQPVYIRGDHRNISEEANPRHFLDGLGGAQLNDGGSGRLDWAKRVASADNPLTARVRVNRIWSRVYGRGLLDSVDDFGKMGGKPSHPELLDYLAHSFMENGWSTKKLIRKLVLARTFQMNSIPGPGMLTADPTNLYLQRMSVGRMDAEAIRDHILSCSGELKNDLYGPSIAVNIDDQPNSRAKPRSGPLDGNGRRSVYLEMRRNFLSSFLRIFDLPNATEPAGRRNVTNVPAQALALLNDPFVHQQAQSWARRVMAGGGTVDDQLRKVHRQAFGREATEADLQWGRKVLKELGGATEAAWKGLCHLMINRKEFIYVF